MIYKSCSFNTIPFLLLTIFAIPVHAEINTVVQAEYAEKTMRHLFEDTGGNKLSELDGDTSAAVFGITFSGQKLYANITAEFPLRDFSGYQIIPVNTNINLSRRDYAFSAGYNLGKQVSVFGGYKYGKTEANITTFNYNGTPPVLDSVTLNRNEISEAGIFIGASSSISINNNNVVSASAAYANMNGEFTNRLDPNGGSGTGLASGNGDIDGYSLSLKLIHQASESTLVNLGYKYNNYNGDLDMRSGERINITSEYNYLSIGLTHFF